SVAVLDIRALPNSLGDFFGAAIDGARDAAADWFAECEHVRFQIVLCRVAAGSGADCMGFVQNEERSGASGQLTKSLMKSRIRMYYSDVCHNRFGQNAGDIF